MASSSFFERLTAAVVRTVFRALRRFCPVARIGRFAIVSSDEAVRSVLAQSDTFGVVYEPRMRVVTGGANFFLGMSDGEEYRDTLARWTSLFSAADLDTLVSPLLNGSAEQICDSADGTVEVIGELAVPVVCSFVENYVGLRGINRNELVSLTSSLFDYLFLPWPVKGKRENVARANAERFRGLVDQAIQDHKRSGSSGNDILSRAVQLQNNGVAGFSDREIRDNLIGIVVGAVPTTIRSSALVLDWLVDHPTELAQGQQVARTGSRTEQFGVVEEVLRFNPFAPILMRRATQEGRVKSNKPKTIKAGSIVVVGLLGTMSDPKAFPNPKSFLLDRTDTNYLHFGSGLHRCFGLQLNSVQITAIVGAVLRQQGLQRADQPRTERRGAKELRVTWTKDVA
jgi:cytochrome P450